MMHASTLPLVGGGQGGGESVERKASSFASRLRLPMRALTSPHPLTPAPSRGGGRGEP